MYKIKISGQHKMWNKAMINRQNNLLSKGAMFCCNQQHHQSDRYSLKVQYIGSCMNYITHAGLLKIHSQFWCSQTAPHHHFNHSNCIHQKSDRLEKHFLFICYLDTVFYTEGCIFYLTTYNHTFQSILCIPFQFSPALFYLCKANLQ